ncbi:MAG: hypothetical protein ABIH42_10025 [Planctomycetota bacterium]
MSENVNMLPVDLVDGIVATLVQDLTESGYQPVPYGEPTPQMRNVAIGYSRTSVPLRQEPVLVDDTAIDPSGRTKLKILVRDAEGSNKSVDALVNGVLMILGVSDPLYETHGGTKTYTFHRHAT